VTVEPRSFRLFVTVGTDHHDFSRMVQWTDDWIAKQSRRIDCFVQRGCAAPPLAAESAEFLTVEEMDRQYASADVVVTHAGPASIADCRRAGHRPIVVARDPSLDEHVDDHQLRFARLMDESGVIDAAWNVEELHGLLDASLVAPEHRSAEAFDIDPRAGVRRLASLVDTLVKPKASRPDPVRVLFIVGLGRSGTTLFERLLAALPGALALGETVHLPARGLQHDELCGCGEPFSSCSFWQNVGRKAFGGWDQLDPVALESLQARVDRTRYVPNLLLPGTRPLARLDLEHYATYYGSLYAAARDVAGADLLVDSSKHVSTLAALTNVADLELRAVHVVRDVRAVAYSWQRSIARPETSDGAAMPRYGPLKVSFWWQLDNLVAEVIGRTIPVMRVRYEDLMEDPVSTVSAVAGFARMGHDDEDISAVLHNDGTAVLGAGHQVAGNPSRFVTGSVPLKLDSKWIADMNPAKRRLLSAVNGPMLRRYGYRIRSASPTP
jgi:UDP-N-acetylglucosamine transferase subunit ALG13